MKVPAKASISACENALLELSDTTIDNILRIPTNVRYLSAGGELAWVQFFMTWAEKFSRSGYIKTYSSSEGDFQIDKTVKRMYGLVASLVVSDIRGMSDSLNLTDCYQKKALSELKVLQSEFLSVRGRSVEILAADHLGLGNPLSLYTRNLNGEFKIKSRLHFVNLAYQMLRKTIVKKSNLHNLQEPSEIIGNILFELFQNTEEHAKTDIAGNQLSTSIRMCQGSYISLSETDVARILEEFEPLGKYFSSFKLPSDKSKLNFFVLSVMDSGPGFAQRQKLAQLDYLSIEEELEATINCFSNFTSKRHSGYGQGLPFVGKFLKKHDGFLRLRTGRLSLFYSAKKDDATEKQPIPLESWTLPNVENLARVRGALLTIVLPVL